MPPERLFSAMLSASDRLGLPLSYPTDILHDQRALYRAPAQELWGWVLYERGTQLVTPERVRSTRQRSPRFTWRSLLATIRECCTGAHYFIGTSSELTEVSFEQFCEAMTAERERAA